MRILKDSKQVGTLYHCTGVRELYGIIKSNTLKASDNYDETISFSRSKIAKMNFIVRLCIDGDKLSNNRKIYPYKDMYWDSDEMEERVDGDITDIKRYIIKVDLNRRHINQNHELPTVYLRNFDDLILFLEDNNVDYNIL